MAIAPLQLPGQLNVPTIDWTPLSELGKTIQQNREKQTLADIGKGLADGTLDYKTAAGQIAGTGNLGATYQFLQLAEAKEKLARETEAGNNFSSKIGAYYSGQGSDPGSAPAPSSPALPPSTNNPVRAQPPVGVPQVTAPQPMDRAPVASSPATWGDAEAEAAGLYEPQSPVGRTGQQPQPGLSLASLGQAGMPQRAQPQPGQQGPGLSLDSLGRMPPPQSAVAPQNVTQAVPQQQPAAPRAASSTPPIPVLLQAMANPNLPAAHKEIAGKLLTRALDDQKEPDKIRTLTALKEASGYQGTILQLEMDLRKASKTEVNVDTQGASAFAKAAGGSIAKRFEDLSKEGDTATTDLALVGQLRDLGQVVKTGAPAAIQGWLAQNGIKVGDNVGAIEAYGAIVDKLTPQQRAPGAGSSSDFDARMFKNSLPKLINTPEGNSILENTLAGLAQYKVDRAVIAEKALSGELKPGEAIKQLRDLPNPYSNFKEFAKHGFRADPNARPSPADAATIQQPPPQEQSVKSMQPAPQQSAAPPMQGARQAPDGNWYIQQNGKTYRVD